MVEHVRFGKKLQPLQHAAVHEQVRQHNCNKSMRCNNTALQMLSSKPVCNTQANMVWVAYSAGGGHVSIDRQGLAAAEQQVVHCGELAVKPDVHVDDRHPLQPLQLTEVWLGLPLLGNDPLHYIDCAQPEARVRPRQSIPPDPYLHSLSTLSPLS